MQTASFGTYCKALLVSVGNVWVRAKWPISAGVLADLDPPVHYPGFLSMKQPGVFLLFLDGMLVHCRVTPSSKFAGTHLYTWVKRGTVRVNCLA